MLQNEQQKLITRTVFKPLKNDLEVTHAKATSAVITSVCVRDSGGQSTQIKYLSKSTDTYSKILLQ